MNLLQKVHFRALAAIYVPDTGGPSSVQQLVTNIINTLLFVVGSLAVIFIIVGGIQYVISSGDPKRIDTAKNTITYAVVGLVVSILAFAIVSFVKGQLIK